MPRWCLVHDNSKLRAQHVLSSALLEPFYLERRPLIIYIPLVVPPVLTDILEVRMPNQSGHNQYGKKHCESQGCNSRSKMVSDIKHIIDPSDDELHAAFQQYGCEKNGSGLSIDEQLARLGLDFPQLDIK